MEKNTQTHSKKYSSLGMGLGLRAEHYQYILEHNPPIEWFEILTENYLVDGGNPLYYLDKVRENYPIVMHGVSLSIGSTDPINIEYLTRVKHLADRIQPKWISDHLCWTGVHQRNIHDLLPLSYTENTIAHVVDRVKWVQDFYQRRILLENVSSYITYKESEMTEWEFLSEIAHRADCLILLDLNNIYVSSYNHGFNPETYLNHIPVDRVQQFHLAGHLNCDDYIIDTHDHPVITEVWDLYSQAIKRFGEVSTMIERDDHIPPFEELWQELEYAKKIKLSCLSNEKTGLAHETI
ncbi:MNIO family bufferin maturase [Legionella sp. WA2022007384]